MLTQAALLSFLRAGQQSLTFVQQEMPLTLLFLLMVLQQ
jgi:hypothetical protein